MKEVKVLSVLLVLLLGASLASSLREVDAPGIFEKVIISEVPRRDIKGLVYVTRTTTMSMTWRQIDAGDPFPWFQLERGHEHHVFPGPEDAVDELLKKVSKLQAIRSLGTPTPAELAEIGLTPPARRFVLRLTSGERVFDVGVPSVDHRSFYVRAKGTAEVFLVPESVFVDLDAPPGAYMARKLLTMKLRDVEEVVIKGAGHEQRFVHVNRDAHDEDDAYWARASSREVRVDTADNFLRRLDGLTIARYLDSDLEVPLGEPFMDLSWRDAHGRKEQLRMWRAESPRLDQTEARYIAVSTATHVPAELGASVAAAIEGDVSQVVSD